MQMSPYLSFNGTCEAAFDFYQQCLDAKLGEMFRYAGSPMADKAPPNWQDKIMHGSIKIGDQTVMAADVASDQYEQPKGFSLALHLKDISETERIYHELSTGGQIIVPIAKTFWAARFAMLIDRFGIPWAINCEAAE